MYMKQKDFIPCIQSYMIGKRTTIDIADYYWTEDGIKKEIKSAEDYMAKRPAF